jgi:hypothetical protein
MNFLKLIDKVLVCFFWFISLLCIFYYLEFACRYFFFCIIIGFFFYTFLYILYFIPYYITDLFGSYIAEDIAEQRMDDDNMAYENADQANIEFWEYYAPHAYHVDFWRGQYWEEEIEDEWDWLNRRGFTLRRWDYDVATQWFENDWNTIMPEFSRGFTITADYPEFLPEDGFEEEYEEKEWFSRTILIAEEDENVMTEKELFHELRIGEFHNTKRWWKIGKRLDKALVSSHKIRRPSDRLLNVSLIDLEILEDLDADFTNNQMRTHFEFSENIIESAYVKKMEAEILDDEDWDFSDD